MKSDQSDPVVAAVAAAATVATIDVVADNAIVATAVAVPFQRLPGYYRSLRRYSIATSLYRTPSIDVCSQFAQFLRPSSAPTRTGDAHSIYSTLVLLNR